MLGIDLRHLNKAHLILGVLNPFLGQQREGACPVQAAFTPSLCKPLTSGEAQKAQKGAEICYSNRILM